MAKPQSTPPPPPPPIYLDMSAPLVSLRKAAGLSSSAALAKLRGIRPSSQWRQEERGDAIALLTLLDAARALKLRVRICVEPL